MGVDSVNIASGSGRNSIRVESKNSYNHGLIILDLEHMPGGICGTWPAFWLLGPDWPNNGEIDIIEGVNSNSANLMTMHTNAGCTITNSGTFSGTVQTSDCDVGAQDNQGCSIGTINEATYGAGFNYGNGGVYATEWTSEAISIWYFPRSAIPSDITSGNPDPSGWGLALSTFSGGCDLDSHMDNMKIIFDTTFCGDWAGVTWSTDATCSSLGATCNDYVQNNPSAFAEAYWLVNSLKVYQSNGAVAPSSGAPTATATSTGVSSSTTYYPSVFTTSTTYTVANTPTYTTTLANTPAYTTTLANTPAYTTTLSFSTLNSYSTPYITASQSSTTDYSWQSDSVPTPTHSWGTPGENPGHWNGGWH